MPIDLTILNSEPRPLGLLESVKARIADAFPAVHFYREPSGAEKLAALGGIELPDILREQLSRIGATIQGDFSIEGVSARFYLSADDAAGVDEVALELRGATALAEPFLERLVEQTGWVIISDHNEVLFGSCSDSRLTEKARALAPPPPSEDELAAAQCDEDRRFYEKLGPERPEVRCGAPNCERGAVALSVFCRAHHFESIHGRPCPFAE